MPLLHLEIAMSQETLLACPRWWEPSATVCPSQPLPKQLRFRQAVRSRRRSLCCGGRAFEIAEASRATPRAWRGTGTSALLRNINVNRSGKVWHQLRIVAFDRNDDYEGAQLARKIAAFADRSQLRKLRRKNHFGIRV